MVRSDGKMTAIQVRVEVFHCFYYGQQFLPGDAVLPFCMVQGSAVVSHNSLLAFLLL